EPAIVVGNSMGASRSVLIERLSAMSYDRGTEQRKSPSAGGSLSFRSDHHQHLTGTGQLQRFRSPVVLRLERDRDRGIVLKRDRARHRFPQFETLDDLPDLFAKPIAKLVVSISHGD